MNQLKGVYTVKILSMPAYVYRGTRQYPTYLTIVQDSYMIGLLRDILGSEGTVTIFNHEDFTGDPIKVINEFFGQRIINSNYHFNYKIGTMDDPVYPDIFSVNATYGFSLDKLGPNDADVNSIVLNDGYELASGARTGSVSYSSGGYMNDLSSTTFMRDFDCRFTATSNDYISVEINITFLPDDFFTGNTINEIYTTLSETSGRALPLLKLELRYDKTTLQCDRVRATASVYSESPYWYVTNVFGSTFNLKNKVITTYDEDNPYNKDIGTSGTGGGDGTLTGGGLDSVDPAEIPSLPSVSAADLGFITMYNPTVTQLQNLANFMWSNAFDLATYKKLFSDPMESIIGLAIVPVSPNIAGSKNVHFGTIDSGINMSYLSSNYVQLDCGSVAIEKYIGCFMDNDPYTKISIYLPFIGIRQLAADDVIGGSIHVVYNIDVLTGACACFIEHSTRGVLYSYNGSCITNVPLTAVNFSGAIQNAVSACLSGVSVMAGMATGAAPITAMGAIGLLNSAANTALNSKPSVQRSGNLGGSAGIMSIQKPYVIIERPSLSVPNNVQHYVGQTANITMLLQNCSGFTMCEYVHIDGVSATADELVEIETLLKEGVIL